MEPQSSTGASPVAVIPGPVAPIKKHIATVTTARDEAPKIPRGALGPRKPEKPSFFGGFLGYIMIYHVRSIEF